MLKESVFFVSCSSLCQRLCRRSVELLGLFVLSAKAGESCKRLGSLARILCRSTKVFEPYVVIFVNWTICNLIGTWQGFIVKGNEIGISDKNKVTI